MDLGARPVAINNGALAGFGATVGGANDVQFTTSGAITGDGGIALTHLRYAVLNANSSSNNFTGPVFIGAQQGTVNNSAVFRTNSLVDSAGAGNIIFGSHTGGHSTIGNGQAFVYGGTVGAPTGALTLNNRQIVLGGTASGVIWNNASDTAHIITVTNDLVVAAAGNKTLFLAGPNAGNNAFNGRITDGTGAVISVTKKDTGTWQLTGSNTYTGATAVNAGILNIQHGNALGSTAGATTVASGGSLQLQGGISVGAAEALSIASGATSTPLLRNISGNNTWNGTITTTAAAAFVRLQSDADLLTLAGTVTGGNVATSIVLQGAGRITVSGQITGPSGVISGTVNAGPASVRTLSNNNTYTGITSVTGGVLLLDHATAVPGGIGTAGGTSNISLSSTVGGVLGLGNGDFTRGLGTGVDQVNIANGPSGFAAYGADRVVNLAGASAAVTWASGNFFTAGNTLVLGHASATHTVDFQNPVVLSATRFFRADNGAAIVDGRLSGAITGSTTFSKAGAGTLELTNTGNAWTGTTFIDSGTLRLGATNVLPNNLVEIKRGTTSDTNPILDLNNFSETIGGINFVHLTSTASNAGGAPSIVNTGGAATLSLGGTVNYRAGSVGFENGPATISADLSLNGAIRTFSTDNNATTTQELIVSGDIENGTGTGGITKTGAGVLVLSGTNAYIGATTIDAGTLLVSGSISGSATTVNSTGTLGGIGTVDAVTVNTGGTLAPGASIGTLSTGALTLAGSSTFALEINTSASTTDLVAITGNLNLADADDTILTISDLAPAAISSGTFAFITYSGIWDGDFFTYDGNVIADGGLLTVGANSFTLDYDLGGNSVALLAIPEPGAGALLIGGLGLLTGFRRRRRKC